MEIKAVGICDGQGHPLILHTSDAESVHRQSRQQVHLNLQGQEQCQRGDRACNLSVTTGAVPWQVAIIPTSVMSYSASSGSFRRGKM